MAQYTINIGALPNDGTGDPLRTAFNETNLNFSQLFAAGPAGSNISIANNTIQATNTNGNIVLATNGIGVVVAGASMVPDRANVRNLGAGLNRFNTVYAQYLDATSIAVSGNAYVAGNLFVTGNTVTANISELNVANNIITVAADSPYPALSDGAGLAVGGTNTNLTYSAILDGWVSNKTFSAPVFIGDGSQLTNVAANASAETLSGNTLANTVINSSLTSVGLLTTLSVAGNATFNATLNAGNVIAGNVYGFNVAGNGAGLTALTASAIRGEVANATWANYAGTALTANLAALATQAINADSALVAVNAQYAGNANVATYAATANTAVYARAATLANSAIVAGRAQTIDIQTSITVTGNIRAGGILTDNYFYANGMPVAFTGNIISNYSNANVAAYLPTYTGNVGANNVISNNVFANSYFYANGQPFIGGANTGVLGDQQFYGNNSVGPYSLNFSTTTNNVLVTINGLTQAPLTTYNVNGNVILFTNTVESDELVDIRFLGEGYVLGDQQFYGTNSVGPYTLINEATSNSVVVTVNGLTQAPGVTYNVSGATITFSTTLDDNELADIRFLSTGTPGPTPNSGYGNTNVVSLLSTGVFAANIVPSGNSVYSLGNSTNQWNDLWLSNSTMYMNGVPISVDGSNTLTVAGQSVVTSGANGFVTVAGISSTGVVNATYFVGDGSFLTGISSSGNSLTNNGFTFNLDDTGNVAAPGNISAVGNIAGDYFIGNGYYLSGITATASLVGNLVGNIDANTYYINNLPSLSVTGNVEADIIIATSLVGTATYASNANLAQYVNVSDVSDSNSYHVVLSFGSGDKDLHIDPDNQLQYNPADGTLTVARVDASDFIVTGNGGARLTDNKLQAATGNSVLLVSNNNNVDVEVNDAGVNINVESSSWNFNNSGNLSGSGNIITAGNIEANGFVSITGNVRGGNINTVGRITATGNVHGNYFIGNGSQLTGVTATANTGDITFRDSLISSSTDIIGITGNSYAEINSANASITVDTNGIQIISDLGLTNNTWNFDNAGNLTLPGNIQSENTALMFSGTITNIQSFAAPTPPQITIAENVFDGTTTGRVTISNLTPLTGTPQANGTWYYESVGDDQFNLYTDAALTQPVDTSEWTAYEGPGGNVVSLSEYTNFTIQGGNVSVGSNGNRWIFDTTSNLTIPGNIVSTTTINIDNRASGNSADIQLYSADDILLQARDRGAGSGSEGGDINIYAGDSAEDGESSGGDIQIVAGNGGNANLDFGGAGGTILIQTGRGGAASTGVGGESAEGGGDLTLRAGDAGSNNGNILRGADGGEVVIEAGDSTGNLAVGGSINLRTGAGGPNAAAGAVIIDIPTSDQGPGGEWMFDALGNLVLPGNTFSVRYANGAPVVLGGPTNTGNVTFDNQIVIGTGDDFGGGGLYLAQGPNSVANLQYFRVRAGDNPTHIHLDTGNSQAFDQYFGDDGKYLKLEAGINGNGGNILISTEGTTGFKTWTFDNTGNLRIPGNIVATNPRFVNLTNENGSPSGPGGQTLTAATATNPGITIIQVGWLVTGNNLTGGTTVTAIGEPTPGILEFTTDTAVTDPFWYNDVYTFTDPVSNNPTWNFGGDANLTLPSNGSLRIQGGEIWQDLDQDLYIRVQDGDDDGFSLYMQVDDGDNTVLGETRLQRDEFEIRFPSGSGTYFQFRDSGVTSLPGEIQGPYGSEMNITISGAVSNSFVGLRTVDNTDTLKSNVTVAVDNVTISTNNAGNTWTFDQTGNLILPGNTFAVNYANGNPVVINSIANTIINGLSSVAVFANANVSIQTNTGIPSGVADFDGSTGDWTGQPLTNLPTIGGSGSGLTVDVSESNGSVFGVVVNIPGAGYSNGDIIVVNGTGNAAATFSIAVPAAPTWTFDNAGTLTFPGGDAAIVPDLGGTTSFQGAANTGVVVTSSGNAGSVIMSWVDQTDDTPNARTASMTFNSAGSGNAQIQVADLAANTVSNWTFGNDGNLTLPGNTFSVNYANNTPVSIGGGSSVAEAAFSIQTSNFTANVGGRYGVNTSGGAVTANLPASPTAGQAVFFADAGGAYATNNLTIDAGTANIMSGDTTMTVSTNNQSVGLFWNGTTWRIYNAG